MKISAKTDYACRALLELAVHWPKTEPLAISVIAGRQRIPLRFLTQILVQLKAAGMVNSIRGQFGGYVLNKSPKEISLRDIIEVFTEVRFISNSSSVKSKNVINSIWQEAEQVLLNYTQSISLDDLLRREKDRGNVPMYTI